MLLYLAYVACRLAKDRPPATAAVDPPELFLEKLHAFEASEARTEACERLLSESFVFFSSFLLFFSFPSSFFFFFFSSFFLFFSFSSSFFLLFFLFFLSFLSFFSFFRLARPRSSCGPGGSGLLFQGLLQHVARKGKEESRLPFTTSGEKEIH